MPFVKTGKCKSLGIVDIKLEKPVTITKESDKKEDKPKK